ncbi:MAG TPA: formate dehydrogenase accessory protein FdhE [Paenalcaligenes sp.]|nr:formate dehydrogenase accessory protein FdhE [Paenalcaligenes sp.]
MQRIISRGEIENLDRTQVPTIYPPKGEVVFAQRAQRLRALAEDSSVSAYLQLMTHLVDAQDALLQKHTDLTGPTAEQIALANEHGLPPLGPMLTDRDPIWRDLLQELLDIVAVSIQSTDAEKSALPQVIQEITAALKDDPEQIETLANQLIQRQIDAETNLAWAPSIMAALQVYFTRLVIDLDLATESTNHNSPFGICPCCGAQPIAGIVKSSGPSAGRRYMVCSLCATEWHIVRVTCSYCESTEGINYYSLEEGDEAIRAEACDKCENYRKVFYSEKDAKVEALADDLNSIELDMLMGKEGFFRMSDNPLLWMPRE